MGIEASVRGPETFGVRASRTASILKRAARPNVAADRAGSGANP
jgi:hypothetical protein